MTTKIADFVEQDEKIICEARGCRKVATDAFLATGFAPVLACEKHKQEFSDTGELQLKCGCSVNNFSDN